ncbi:MAG: MFS transporter, partial [Acidilobaceae archaeon]
MIFILLSLVSLLADTVYEGGRSVSGAFLAFLNSPDYAPAIVGAGDLVGSLLRLVTGLVATAYASSTILWGFTIAGYALTALSIPALALAGSWELAVMLYVLERVGKGLRAPSRDVILSEVTEKYGVGKAFGFHELLDQVGAFAGPLLVASLIAVSGYRAAFAALLIPGAIAIALIIISARLYPSIKSVGKREDGGLALRLGAGFWWFAAGIGLLSLGFMHWAIASYYLYSYEGIPASEIGFIYAIAMAVDAVVAVPMGALFDRHGIKVLYILPASSFLFALLLLNAPREAALALAIPWGLVMSAEESILRASVVKLVAPERRAAAFGIYSIIFGGFWAIGGALYS